VETVFLKMIISNFIAKLMSQLI